MIHFAQLSFPIMLPIILRDKHNIWLCLSACLTPIWYDMNCWNFKNHFCHYFFYLNICKWFSFSFESEVKPNYIDSK